jgi:UDP-N-acetylmuramoyl-L-alanyl-D-glutamate--2,6-diaminopimelate ligase
MFLSFYHFLWSFLGAVFYGFPSKRIFVLGVTGTKGKSTVLELINAILETAGKKTALLSSIRIKIGKDSRKNYLDNTMPGRAFIQRFLRKAVRSGCDYALVEVTSQGILQHRHRFIKWDAALFTNLAPEHIEAHGGFENYRNAKLSFFRYVSALKPKTQNLKPKLFFINKDDPNAGYFKEAVQDGQIILYSQGGDFSQDNIAAAVAFSRSQRIPEEYIKQALKNFPGVPGRMEVIQKEPFRVIIDYAHTPDSLEKVYQILKPKTYNLKPKLICVLGSAGGGRDKWKRPKIGEIAGQYCQEIIITNEDPYNEEPLEILNQIEAGIFNPKPKTQNLKPYKILDRKEGIRKALSLAKEGDTVIITGKGCESWLHLEKGKKISWDERRIVENEIRNIRT